MKILRTPDKRFVHLKEYPFQKPFFLSGGIGLNEVEKIKEFQQLNLPLHAIDVNSKFETAPGLKNMKDLKIFIESLEAVTIKKRNQ